MLTHIKAFEPGVIRITLGEEAAQAVHRQVTNSISNAAPGLIIQEFPPPGQLQHQLPPWINAPPVSQLSAAMQSILAQVTELEILLTPTEFLGLAFEIGKIAPQPLLEPSARIPRLYTSLELSRTLIWMYIQKYFSFLNSEMFMLRSLRMLRTFSHCFRAVHTLLQMIFWASTTLSCCQFQVRTLDCLAQWISTSPDQVMNPQQRQQNLDILPAECFRLEKSLAKVSGFHVRLVDSLERGMEFDKATFLQGDDVIPNFDSCLLKLERLVGAMGWIREWGASEQDVEYDRVRVDGIRGMARCLDEVRGEAGRWLPELAWFEGHRHSFTEGAQLLISLMEQWLTPFDRSVESDNFRL